MSHRPHVAVIGAGIGGLASAVALAARGARVTVYERAATPGGKMRQVTAAGAHIDAGPTVFTMRWVFDRLFAAAGSTLQDHLTLRTPERLARHAWTNGGALDLYADRERAADAIAHFAGAREAEGYRRFCARAAEIHATLRPAFMERSKPTPFSLARDLGIGGFGALLRTSPFTSLWAALGDHFRDPRLRQLFARYATYVGSSPFACPATLMLIAHVEQDGVWLVDGGMHAVARALVDLGATLGVEYRYGCEVTRIEAPRGQVTAIGLEGEPPQPVDAVVFNGDANALAQGALGAEVAGAVAPTRREHRSLSAITWCLNARTRGFELDHHTVFFADDYAREFSEIFSNRLLPPEPTVYLCAQDRGPGRTRVDGEAERLLVLINAPADGDTDAPLDVASAAVAAERVLAGCGLEVDGGLKAGVATAPSGFNGLFPHTGGALYGRSTHGPFASFARPTARTGVSGLYLAGGSAHPGAGVPMATLSGLLAAEATGTDLGLQLRS